MLLEIFNAFAFLGATAFGGPASHIALMEIEFVERRKWLSLDRFREHMATAALLPGPTSTELALLIGQERGGFPGLLMAGCGFILPAFALVLAIAMLLGRQSMTPAFESAMRGIQPVLIAIIVLSLVKLLQSVFKHRFLYVCALAALVAGCLGQNILLILFGAGVLNLFCHRVVRRPKKFSATLAAMLVAWRSSSMDCRAAEALSVAASSAPVGDWNLLLIFLKIGAVFYGGGYMLLAFLREDFVLHLNVISEHELMTAVSVGQFTPGPLFTAATFIGYRLNGLAGAVLATVGIFAPAFLYAGASRFFVPSLRKSSAVTHLLDGVNAASCALMALVTWHLQRQALVDWKTDVIAAGAMLLLLRFKLNAAWLVLAGGVLGFALL